MSNQASFLRQSRTAQLIVSRQGISAWLVVLCAAIMSFLMLYSLSLGNVASDVARSWRDSLSHSATVRIQAPVENMEEEAAAVEEVLRTTSGLEGFEEITSEAQLRLLEPWLGSDIPLEVLTMPRVYRVKTSADFDDQNVIVRLKAEAPHAIWDDHLRWRGPLLQSANRIMSVSWISTALMGMAFALMIFLSADASTAANATGIKLLRMVGATDQWIRSGFERKFVLRSLLGSIIGAAFGLLAYWAIVRLQVQNSDLGRGISDVSLPVPSALFVIVLCVFLGYVATRISATRYLMKNT